MLMGMLVGLLCTVVAVAAALLFYRRMKQQNILAAARKAVEQGGISSVEEVVLGGVRQRVLIQTRRTGTPVLLVLHGGPGMPVPGVGCREADWVFNLCTRRLREQYTVVFWDQRGTGASWSQDIDPQTMHVDQHVEDAAQLVEWLTARFGTEKLTLCGISWGSLLGLKLAARCPQKLNAYYGLAQIVDWTGSDKEAYTWLLQEVKARGHNKALQELERMGPPPYTLNLANWNQLRKWLMLLGGFIYNGEETKHPGMAAAFRLLLSSPDYSLGNLIRMFTRGMKLSYSPQTLRDMDAFNASIEIPRLEIPATFIHGRLDRVISGRLLEQYVDQLDSPLGKSLHWLERSAHMFCPDDARLVEELLLAGVNPTLSANTKNMVY